MAVYLLHIDPPLKHSRHYVGFSFTDEAVPARVRRHQQGQGGVLTRRAVEAGSTITLVHLWPGAPRTFERYLKSFGSAGKWCPACGRNERPMPTMDGLARREARLQHQMRNTSVTENHHDADEPECGAGQDNKSCPEAPETGS